MSCSMLSVHRLDSVSSTEIKIEGITSRYEVFAMYGPSKTSAAYTDNSVKSGHGEAGMALVLSFTVLVSGYFLEGGCYDEVCSTLEAFSKLIAQS